MTFYQVEITLYKYNWWTGKWVTKEVFSSPVIHKDYVEAERWRATFYSVLKSRGWKLKEGNWSYVIQQLNYEPKPEYTPSPEIIAHYRNMQNTNTSSQNNRP